MFSSRGTMRYEERGQGYRDVEKVGKHCLIVIIRSSNEPTQDYLIPSALWDPILQHLL